MNCVAEHVPAVGLAQRDGADLQVARVHIVPIAEIHLCRQRALFASVASMLRKRVPLASPVLHGPTSSDSTGG